MPKEIVNKPGTLDEREWEIIKAHTIEGQRILERVGGFMREVGLVVRSHHERWDGGGYPDMLAGESIPLRGTHHLRMRHLERDAHRPLLPQRALIRGRDGRAAAASGSQLDPHIVEALVAVITEGEQGGEVHLSSARSHSRLLVA